AVKRACELIGIFATSLGHVVFFFQAEDGIRDFHVTGVQTCALPIYPRLAASIFVPYEKFQGQYTLDPFYNPSDRIGESKSTATEIGRASCRESVYHGGGPSVGSHRHCRQ